MIIFTHHKNLTSFNPVLTIVTRYRLIDQLKFEDIEQGKRYIGHQFKTVIIIKQVLKSFCFYKK